MSGDAGRGKGQVNLVSCCSTNCQRCSGCVLLMEHAIEVVSQLRGYSYFLFFCSPSGGR